MKTLMTEELSDLAARWEARAEELRYQAGLIDPAVISSGGKHPPRYAFNPPMAKVFEQNAAELRALLAKAAT
jgi:hypothetical protein